MEYKIIESNYSKRRKNREEYIDSVEDNISKKHSISILTLCYNNNIQFFALLDFLTQDRLYGNFAITIVQNSDNKDLIQDFKNRIWNYKEVIVVYPKENVWSAWWYALWQECIIAEWFTHFIIIEDDVQLYNHDTIASTIERTISHPQEVIFINPPINTWWEHSWYVQYACYPISLIKIAGVLDPRYYFRCEDLEWKVRLEYAIKYNGFKKHIIKKDYYHPYIKPWNNSWSWIYFSLRNQIWTIRKYHSLYLWFLAVLVMYLTYWIATTIRTRKKAILMNVLLAMRDWLQQEQNLTYNKKILSQLWWLSPITIEGMWFTGKNIDRTEMLYDMDTTWFMSLSTIAKEDRLILNKHKWNIPIIWWFQPSWWPIISCLSKIYYIEYIQLDKQILSWKSISQWLLSRGINLLLFLPSILLWCLIILLYSIILFPLQYIKK